MRVCEIFFIQINIDPPVMGRKENFRSRHMKTHILKAGGLLKYVGQGNN